MSHFKDAVVEHDNRVYSYSAGEGQALEGGSQYWHSPGNPSTWLAIAVFLAVRNKFRALPQRVALQLAAQALDISLEGLVSSIRWHENYMQWHDGDYTYRILEDEEQV